MVLCWHFPYHFSGFHTLVLLMGNYYHLSPVCVSCCSSALQQHLMAAIHLVAESSATADRLQVRTEQDRQQGTELVPQLTTLLVVVAPVPAQAPLSPWVCVHQGIVKSRF